MIAIQELTNELFMASSSQWLTMFKSIKWKFVKKKNKRIRRVIKEIGMKKEEIKREKNRKKRRNRKKKKKLGKIKEEIREIDGASIQNRPGMHSQNTNFQ